MTFDLAIIGSGFAGSLLAMIARRLGRSAVLIEKARHPRFAIGESSTPLANLVLEDLASRYQLDGIAPFAKWGTWQRVRPEVACGLKRGFSFFHHEWNRDFQPRADRRNELLVAASPHDEIADTHWYRPDFDATFAAEAGRAGVVHLEETTLHSATFAEDGARLAGTQGGQPIEVHARFVVDASGPRGALWQLLPLGEKPSQYLPETEGLFAHFRGVQPFAAAVASSKKPPFPIDDAALHHVFPGGWIWVLRFNNRVVSAGVAATKAVARELRFADGAAAWERLLTRLPAVRRQFAEAEVVEPFRHVPRLAFRSAAAAGAGWALLPSAAGFIDPLLSTGFPLTLLGVERLARTFESDWDSPRFAGQLASYERDTFADLDAAEQLVAALYANMGDFAAFTHLARIYFAAASFAETTRRLGSVAQADGFLLRQNRRFAAGFDALCRRATTGPVRDLGAQVDALIAPIDIAGLTDRQRRNWYPVCADDLFAGAEKLGATREQICELLERCGMSDGAAESHELAPQFRCAGLEP